VSQHRSRHGIVAIDCGRIMSVGFPQGRSITSAEIAVDESQLPLAFSLVWEKQSFRRELPRLIWVCVSFVFILAGVFAIGDTVPRILFILMGLIGLAALSSRLEISFYGGQRIEKKTSLGGFCLGSEIKSLPCSCSFSVRNLRYIDGRRGYLVIAGEDFLEEVLLVDLCDDFDETCRMLNHALLVSKGLI
jgi:hypothetical protein